MSTEREMGDPLGAFACPKCGGLTIRPRLRWERVNKMMEHIVVWCSDCDYSETRPTKDAP